MDRRPPVVLRVPLLADGALGRPGLRGLHRRRPDRRGARPQRAAPLALLGHRRRPGRARLRGRRARPRPGLDRPQGPAPAGPDVPRRHRGAPDHRGRRDQVDPRRRAPLRRSGCTPGWSTSTTSPSASTSCTPTPRSPAASRSSATPRRSCGSCSRRWPTPAARRSGSMGTDTPIAALSDKPRLLFDYFAQLFAQVTNPPLDAIREELVTSLAGLDRPRGQPARPDAGVLPPDRAAVPGLLQRRPRQDPAHQPRRRHARLRVPHRPRPLRRRGRRRRDGGPHRRDLRGGQPGDRRRRPDHRALRPARDPGAGADPVAAAHRRDPPPPGPREDPHPGRPARRGRRRPRGAPRRAPHRLRRGGGQPLPRHGVGRGPRPRGLLRQDRARGGGQEPHQGARQGRAQGDVQDGRLDRRVLHRGADLRGRRPVAGGGRQVLHRHRLQARRRRARRDRRGGRPPARHGVPPRRHRAVPPRAGHRRRVPVAPRGRAAPVRPRDGVPAAALHADRALRHLQAVHEPGRRAVPAADDAARAVPVQGRARHRPRPDPDRRGRAGLRDRQAVLDRRDVLRLDLPGGARDARDRDEPAGRQVQHRRGRRGRRAPLRPRAALVDQAGRVRPVRRDVGVPHQLRRHPDQDGAGREARRGRPAARARRSTRGSRRPATPRPASA